MPSKNFQRAKLNKNDEFYTQYEDIEKEINAYFEYNNDVFRNKTILCPCDDPEWSNFTKYFAANFERFGLRKLISTSYAKSSGSQQLSTFEKESPNFDKDKHDTNGKIFILEKDIDNSGRIDYKDIQFNYLEGDGDFNSSEVKKLRDEADIIVTNPPFSMWRKFFLWIMETQKQFIIVGPLNAVKYRESFPFLKDNKIWLGSSYFNGGAAFFVAPQELYNPSLMSNQKNAFLKNGKFYWRVNGVRWFTNLEHGHRHEQLTLMTKADNLKYNKQLIKYFNGFGFNDYPIYDNYEAIEVKYVNAIPADHNGIMGVTISFFDKYCPEQFDVLGCTQRGCHDDVPDTKKYDDYWELTKEGEKTGSSGGKTNENANIHGKDGEHNYFINADGDIVQSAFDRIFIKLKEL